MPVVGSKPWSSACLNSFVVIVSALRSLRSRSMVDFPYLGKPLNAKAQPRARRRRASRLERLVGLRLGTHIDEAVCAGAVESGANELLSGSIKMSDARNGVCAVGTNATAKGN